MLNPAEQTSDGDITIAQQQKNRREIFQEPSVTAAEIESSIRSTGGRGSATMPKRKSSTEKNLCEVAEKAKHAPRDG
jgi:hypothetical protein